MKNKLLKISILVLTIIIFMQITVFASRLTLNISIDKQKIKKGDKFTVIVSWKEGMQAADFYLKYDSEKLKFIKTDISDEYINSEEKGQVKTAWFSLDNTDKTEIKYIFEAIDDGRVKFETMINGGFATGDLEILNKYDEATLVIKILSNPIENLFKIIGIVIGTVIIFILIKVVINIKSEKSRKKIR